MVMQVFRIAGFLLVVSLLLSGQRKFVFPEIVNIKDYGAVGDGAHDDRVAIANAIHALLAIPEIQVLWFGSGNYTVENCKSIGNGDSLVQSVIKSSCAMSSSACWSKKDRKTVQCHRLEELEPVAVAGKK